MSSSKKPSLHDRFVALASANNCRIIDNVESSANMVKFECLDCRVVSEEQGIILRTIDSWCKICKDGIDSKTICRKILVSLELVYQQNFNFNDSELVYDFLIDEDEAFLITLGKNGSQKYIDLARKMKIPLIEIEEELMTDIIQLKTKLKEVFRPDSNSKGKKECYTLKLSEDKIFANLPISDKDFTDYFWTGITKEKIRKIGAKSKSFVYYFDAPKGKKLKTYIAYCRISTKHQIEGKSMYAQFGNATSFVDQKQGFLRAVYFDFAISAKNVHGRPALVQLRGDIKTGEVLLIANSSRLGRDFTDMVMLMDEFKKKNVEVITTDDGISTESANGRVFVRMRAVFDNETRDLISKSVAFTMGALASEGKLKSKTPYGYTSTGRNLKLILNPEEQKGIERIRQIREDNPKVSMNAFLKLLNDDSTIPRRKGKKWYRPTVEKILDPEQDEWIKYYANLPDKNDKGKVKAVIEEQEDDE